MTYFRLRRAMPVALFTICLTASVRPAVNQRPLGGDATEGEIAALILALSDPTYGRRTHATRRLCAIGNPAREALEAAASGADPETALRAQAVIAVLDDLLFGGVSVRLACAKSSIAWDEHINLDVIVANRSAYPARIPFAISVDVPPPASDARQVGDLLDVADMLRVRRVEGSAVDLVVDDITADPAVEAAVQERLNGGPMSLLPPGEERTLTVRHFNRGWARYPLLDAGDYRIRLEYLPEWGDEVLAAEGIGRVISNELSLTVVRGAPEAISRRGREASVEMRREGDVLIATATNRSDLPILVNRNFGLSPPFARGEWVYELGSADRTIPLAPHEPASMEDFDAGLLTDVAAGKTVELTRTTVADLLVELDRAGAAPVESGGSIYFVYTNLCDRRWQRRQGDALLDNAKAPPVFRRPLPRRLLGGRFMTERAPLPARN